MRRILRTQLARVAIVGTAVVCGLAPAPAGAAAPGMPDGTTAAISLRADKSTAKFIGFRLEITFQKASSFHVRTRTIDGIVTADEFVSHGAGSSYATDVNVPINGRDPSKLWAQWEYMVVPAAQPGNPHLQTVPTWQIGNRAYGPALPSSPSASGNVPAGVPNERAKELRVVRLDGASAAEIRRRIIVEPKGTMVHADGRWYQSGVIRETAAITSARMLIDPGPGARNAAERTTDVSTTTVIRLPGERYKDPSESARGTLPCADTLCAVFSPHWQSKEPAPDIGQVKDPDYPSTCDVQSFRSGKLYWPCPGELVYISHGDADIPQTFRYARTFVLAKDWVFDHLAGSPDCSWYSPRIQMSGATLTLSIADGPKLADLRKANQFGQMSYDKGNDLTCALDVFVRGPRGSSPL